jgi:hypothetical protein
MKTTSTYNYSNFDLPASGRLITTSNGLAVVQARNPFGTHNFVLVDCETQSAIRHGNVAVAAAAAAWM